MIRWRLNINNLTLLNTFHDSLLLTSSQIRVTTGNLLLVTSSTTIAIVLLLIRLTISSNLTIHYTTLINIRTTNINIIRLFITMKWTWLTYQSNLAFLAHPKHHHSIHQFLIFSDYFQLLDFYDLVYSDPSINLDQTWNPTISITYFDEIVVHSYLFSQLHKYNLELLHLWEHDHLIIWLQNGFDSMVLQHYGFHPVLLICYYSIYLHCLYLLANYRDRNILLSIMIYWILVSL